VELIYANRDTESVIFVAPLRDLVNEYPERVAVIHWLEAVQGLPNETTLGRLLAPYAGRDVFICGPSTFMKSARGAVESFGVPRSRIHIENFVSLSGDLFTDKPVEVDHGTTPAAEVVVRLNGDTHTLTWTRKDTLIDLLVERGSRRRIPAARVTAEPANACLSTAGSTWTPTVPSTRKTLPKVWSSAVRHGRPRITSRSSSDQRRADNNNRERNR
jgi:hypothetical protein